MNLGFSWFVEIQMVTLEPTRLHWIKDDGRDDPADLCAHSPVRFEIDGDVLVSAVDGDVTVSAAAIYLLRTLEADHSVASPVGDQLFPCCGHAMYDTGDDDVVICGCPNGSNAEVAHVGDSVRICTTHGRTYLLSADEWRQAVYAFADRVNEFYADSSAKTPADETDAKGFAKLREEWKRRRDVV